MQSHTEPEPAKIAGSDTTTYRGGPAGAELPCPLLKARQGIPVTHRESHEAFERDFRADLIHSSVLRIMDDEILGMTDVTP